MLYRGGHSRPRYAQVTCIGVAVGARKLDVVRLTKGRGRCVSRTLLKLSHSPHNLAHLCTYCRHCTASLAWSGRPGLGREAVLQRVSSCAAQPQCSMKEPPAALLLRHEIDRPACASSASSESGSLELLLILHALVGATICGAQTNRSAQVERATRCSRRQDGDMRTPRGRVPVKVAVSCAAGPAQRRCIRAPGDFHQYPV